MRKRCRHGKYAELGITVCERWDDVETGFLNFLADMGERPDGMTLDRIDPDGNYEPDNCRWATPKEQTANRRVQFLTERIRRLQADNSRLRALLDGDSR